MKIGIDLDGVVADFTRSFLEVANTIWPGRVPIWSVNEKWDWSDLGFTNKEVQKVWRAIKLRPNFWMTLRAYPDSIHAIARHQIAFPFDELYYITARTDTLGAPPLHQSQRWLESCGIAGVGTNVLVTSADEKIDVYKSLDIEVGVDDYLQTAASSGGIIHLLDRPWNREGRPRGINVTGSIEDFFGVLGRGRTLAERSGKGEGLQ